jgi:hypothetical protein
MFNNVIHSSRDPSSSHFLRSLLTKCMSSASFLLLYLPDIGGREVIVFEL